MDTKFTESKRDAVIALSSIVTKVGVASGESCDPSCNLCPKNVVEVFELLFTGVNDYTRDGRGDVGALVREASMTSICNVLLKITDSGHSELISPQV